MDTLKINKKQVQMIAHRGVSGLESENTAAAFIAAGNRSYWGIETDVHLTADGALILIHDSNTLRMTGKEMIVEESRYEDLRGLTVKDVYGEGERWDLRLPSLSEYVGICKKYEKEAVLELKEDFGKAALEKVIAVFRELGYLDHVVFISFHLQNLLDLRELLPDCRAQYLLKNITEEDFELLKKHRLDLDIDHRDHRQHRSLTKEWVDRIHGEGLLVNCWTVNEAENAEQLISWGVDQITTNILE